MADDDQRQRDFTTIQYETGGSRVARITLNRPDSRNAQNFRMLYELNEAFDRAAQDDGVHVIVLAANGPHFSSGHDLRDGEADDVLAERRPVGTWCGFGCAGAEGTMAKEKELYLGLCERWRNVPKPTIAEVHGKVIAGGLMLVWPCDLIVASEDASFIDNTVAMGVAGAEFFQHPWELGVRKAKELLFTSRPVSAADAHRLGMVNHVVPRDRLTAFTMELAAGIAEQPLFALKLAKEAVNTAQDCQGRANAMQTSFALHQLCHSHNQGLYDLPIDPAFFEAAPSKAAAAMAASSEAAPGTSHG
ncbi:enoyl-CoA hydratase [Actinomadura sp. B10D3]|uniref:enoyl-CoA hydratase n=1 Tax=Actinomadura sp. B10D3 TaxID=3153557 RepID=UPI00325E935C